MKSGSISGLVGLTFDDGYEDFLHTAVPILERYGFSATVFAIGGLLGARNGWIHVYEPRPDLRLLGAHGLREVSQRGMEVGSHSMNHYALPSLNAELLEKEVTNSRQILSEVLGEDVQGFCYPYGKLDYAAVRAVRGAGYDYACSVNKLCEGSQYDLLRVPIMGDRDTSLRFAMKLRFFSRLGFVKQRILSRYSQLARESATRATCKID
jgi:peptidoglycan/xylan/chitin deacetylase (PgdA/CDA1 family)